MGRVIGLGLVAILAIAMWTTLFVGEGVGDHGEVIPKPDLHFPAEGAEPMAGPFADRVDLELVFEVGEMDGPLAFGTIQDLAASSDSLVAVADRFGCAIRVFQFPSGELVSDLGGCGDGPGEFRRVHSIAFKADTLLVFDFLRARIMRINPRTGEQFSAELPPFPRADAPIMSLDASDDAVLYAPGWSGTSPRRALLAVHADDGSTHDGLTDAGISLTNRDLSMARFARACRLKGGGRVVAANIWTLQAVILDPSLRPLFNHIDDEPWAGPREEGGPGRWMPGSVGPDVACADSIGLVRYRTQERVGEYERRVGLGLLLVISSSGEILQREVVADTMWPHPAAMAPAAGMGDVVFFFQNTWGPYPSVRGYRIRTQGEDR